MFSKEAADVTRGNDGLSMRRGRLDTRIKLLLKNFSRFLRDDIFNTLFFSFFKRAGMANWKNFTDRQVT